MIFKIIEGLLLQTASHLILGVKDKIGLPLLKHSSHYVHFDFDF